MREDPFTLNIEGVANLVNDGMNKMPLTIDLREGVVGPSMDVLELDKTDEELLKLKGQWETKSQPYTAKIEPRQKANMAYYLGRQNNSNGDKVTATNLIFEAEETFIPQALSKNPDPVVWSDDTKEGQVASNQIKTMLQYQAHNKGMRRKLGVMVRHWSVYFVGVMKYGWSMKDNDFSMELRKPNNFVMDPDAYIDEFGNYRGIFLGEKIESSAQELADMYPEHKTYISLKADDKMGTQVVRTEWWTDDYCFTTFYDLVLDKHRNEYFNYDQAEKDEYGIETVTPGKNHFAHPRMPYTFLSVFSMQEHPHDVTNLIEQSIPNQDRITDRDIQISRNLAAGNNSIAFSGVSFDKETAAQAAQALEAGHPVLVPDGNVDGAIRRIPANDIPSAVFNAQENDKESLRSIFGTAGLSSSPQDENTTARGMILNQSHDSSRIGGGIGEAIEAVADTAFNWMMQLMCVFYDEEHYASMIGNGQAVTYVTIVSSDINRQFNIKVEPDSMKPKDEITKQNLAMDLFSKGALDPISLFEELNYPDPQETAKKVALWTTNPQAYMATYFPEKQPMMPQDSANPEDPARLQEVQGDQPDSLGANPASSNLSQVPLQTNAMPQ